MNSLIRRPPWYVTFALLLLTFAEASLAETLPDTDHGPLTGVFGFMDASEGALFPDHQQHRWGVSLSTASHNIEQAGNGENLLLDGETTRLELRYDRRLGNRLTLGIVAPYVWHESGGLDAVIEDWHSIFGFPDGPREDRARDLIEFSYTGPSGESLQLRKNVNGVGDVRLFGGWKLRDDPRHPIALRFSVKLQTGESTDLLGSGGADIGIGLAGDVSKLWGVAGLSGFYRVNATLVGGPEFLAERHEDLVGQLAGGLSYAIADRVNLILQGRVRSAVYDSAVENLGDASLTTTFGASFRMGDSHRLILSVGEDLNPSTAPDVTFQLTLRSATF